MERSESIIGGRKCRVYGNRSAKSVLIQPVDARDLQILEREIEAIRAGTETAFTLAAFSVADWNRDLSPWEAPPVFGSERFGDGARDTLSFIADTLIPALGDAELAGADSSYYLGGYSLAGLFALWSAYETDRFRGVAGASPSVWFPDWEAFTASHALRSPRVYLSLGDREEKTRNPVMASVGDRLRRYHGRLAADPRTDCTLEWNPGNHFAEPEMRMAKGFVWLLGGRSGTN